MESQITQSHLTDEQGRPAGGHTEGRGFRVDWQNGPLVVDGERVDPNGAFVEDIIAAAVGRIDFYQSAGFGCPENVIALSNLRAAQEALRQRTRTRTQQGVEGTHAHHRT